MSTQALLRSLRAIGGHFGEEIPSGNEIKAADTIEHLLALIRRAIPAVRDGQYLAQQCMCADAVRAYTDLLNEMDAEVSQ